MNRRIVLVALTAVVLALTLLGVPLAIAARTLLILDESNELTVEAYRVSVNVRADQDRNGGKFVLGDTNENMHVGVYDPAGRLITGEGPDDADPPVRAAVRHGTLQPGATDNDLVVAVPVRRGGDVEAVVRTSSPRSLLIQKELIAFSVMLGVALFALAAALLLALRLARRLSVPLEELRETAEELGEGNFAVRASATGIGELDDVAASMNATAARLGQLLERERAFTAHASHQLRTPLTALRLRMDAAIHGGEDPASAARGSMAIIHDLETTVEDLLAISRGRIQAVAPLDLDSLLGGLAPRWAGLLAAEGRTLTVRMDDPPLGTGREATVRQVLDVLIDNAYRHGGGAVRVVAREASGALAIDVVDEGRAGIDSAVVDAEFTRVTNRAGPPAGPGATLTTAGPALTGTTELLGRRAGARARAGTRRGGTGIGLGLARSLLDADGGRLLLSSEPGRTCATVLLPAAEPG